MRSNLSSLRRQRVVGYTAGSLEEADGPFFFLRPTRVGTGGSHFFFCACLSLSFWSPSLGCCGNPDGVFP